MDLGTLLVVLGLVLALVALFVDTSSTRFGDHRLLAVAVLLVAAGVLLGASGFSLR